MPVYRTPVFEDASGRAPGVRMGPGIARAAELGPHVQIEDCGTFFRVSTLRVGLRPGWQIAGAADLAAPVVVAGPVVAGPAVVEPIATEPDAPVAEPVADAEPAEEAEAAPKKRTKKK